MTKYIYLSYQCISMTRIIEVCSKIIVANDKRSEVIDCERILTKNVSEIIDCDTIQSKRVRRIATPIIIA